MVTWLHRDWPVLTHYEGEQLRRVALPLGGIGTGTVSLGGRGNFQDWEIANRPAKGFNGAELIFMLHVGGEGLPGVTRALEGLLQPPYEGASGDPRPYHGVPRMRSCSFHTAYPLAQVRLSDPDVPVDVRLEAFNPLVPADAERSGIPVAILRYVLRNKSDKPLAATLCGTLKNTIGNDGTLTTAKHNHNAYREEGGLRGLLLSSQGVDPSAEPWGTLALSTTAPHTTHRCAWPANRWGGAVLALWDDLSSDGLLETSDDCPPQDTPLGSLATTVSLAPGAEQALTFLLTWHFPNRQTWTPAAQDSACTCTCSANNRVGNYYTTVYQDAWDVAQRTAPQLPDLEERTLRFVQNFCGSDLPAVVKEAALYNLSTLRSQTCFRTEDGRFLGWEGCNDGKGCCFGSCTHVWNYEQATAFTFADLSRHMRETEFLHATDEQGLMSFRVTLPLERAREFGIAAADGQMGCIMKVYRDWQLAGDDAWLRRLWPQVRRALEFAWIPGGWDADQDGVMEGCQHNTLDIEYYGPNPLMAGWYLGALRAAEEMARHLGEEDFAQRCRALFENGRHWVDEHLFNGEYYIQQIVPPAEGQLIAPGLRAKMGAEDLRDPDFQLGSGCQVDQLVGQYMAHVAGLGYVLDAEHVRATLRSIMRYNFHENLYAVFNPMRTYALNDESALLVCSYPHGGRPRRPEPYFAELFTGFEYTAAAHMLYEGMIDEGLKCIAAVRARYDGARRNPFDEAECGHHYARAMASWATVLALTGFHYSAVTQRMAFSARPGMHFWSNGSAWGTCTIAKHGPTMHAQLSVLYGQVILKSLGLSGYRDAQLAAARTVSEGESLLFELEPRG